MCKLYSMHHMIANLSTPNKSDNAHCSVLTTSAASSFAVHFVVTGASAHTRFLHSFSFGFESGQKTKMTHDAVWFSRPRKFGKGSRQWWAPRYLAAVNGTLVFGIRSKGYEYAHATLHYLAASVPTRRVSSANTVLICAVSASARRRVPLDSSRCDLSTSHICAHSWCIFFSSLRTDEDSRTSAFDSL